MSIDGGDVIESGGSSALALVKLAERLKRAEAVIAEASESLRRYADRDVAIGILVTYQNGADHDD